MIKCIQQSWKNSQNKKNIKINWKGLHNLKVERVGMKDSNTMETVPFDGKTNGEIMLRNNTMMLGYLKNSKATQEAYRND